MASRRLEFPTPTASLEWAPQQGHPWRQYLANPASATAPQFLAWRADRAKAHSLVVDMARIFLVLPLLGGAAGSASSPRGLRGTGRLMGTCETAVAANTGWRNFASLPEIARSPGSVSNVFCAQKCTERGCSFWTYQDEPNSVCEGLQPHPKPVQPALGDDACILFGGQCQKEENACWDVVLPSTLAPTPAPSPFIVLSPNTCLLYTSPSPRD